jgi:hypothetical protein
MSTPGCTPNTTTAFVTPILKWLKREVVWTQRLNYALSGPGMSVVYAQLFVKMVVTGGGELQTDFKLGTCEAYIRK